MARLLIVEDNHALAALLVSAACDRGYDASAVHSGAAALRTLEEARPDVAIVDLLLPDMPGTRILDQLAAAHVPAFAVSGVFKGAPFAEEATHKHGALAFFEKPFELSQLLGAVDAACGVEPDALPEIVLDIDDADPFAELALLDVTGLLVPEEAAGSSAQEAASAAEVAPSAEEAPPADEAPPPVPDADAHAHAGKLPFAERGQVWERPAAAAPVTRPRAARAFEESGTLAEESVPRLLNAFHEARLTGEVRLRQGNVLKVVSFANGRAVAAASNIAQERFLRFCVRRGAVPEARAAEVAELAQREGLRTGEAVQRLGLLTEAQRAELLAEQVKEIVWSTFAWREGQYEVAPRRAPRPGTVPLSLFLGELVLEGVMRTERLVALREKVPRARHLTPTADPPYALHDFRFSGEQALLLAYCDGSKSVEDLLAITDLSERDALATLHALELLGLVEERRDTPRSRRISFGL